jgi:glycosyltransferase involved in cell wall biosynthesis
VSTDLVSVIVAFYNAERFLEDAITSVLVQRYSPLEVILVDDGSTDRSEDLARTLSAGHPEVRLLRSTNNAGPSAARNAGLAEATGNYVTFLDADDVMLPDRLSSQVAYLVDRLDVDLVLCGEEQVLDADAPHDLIRRRRSGAAGLHFHIMSMMVRRSVFDRVGGFEPSLAVAEDLDWLFRAGRAGLVVGKIERVLTRRRMHDRNLSYRTADIQHSMLRSLRHLLHAR